MGPLFYFGSSRLRLSHMVGQYHVDHLLDAGAGFLLHDGDGPRDGDGLGVDEIAGRGAGEIVYQSGGGIDVHAGAHHHEVVGLLAEGCGNLDVGDGFAKLDDVGTQLRPVGGFVAEMDVGVANVDDEVGVVDAAAFGQLAVEVYHLA